MVLAAIENNADGQLRRLENTSASRERIFGRRPDLLYEYNCRFRFLLMIPTLYYSALRELLIHNNLRHSRRPSNTCFVW